MTVLVLEKESEMPCSAEDLFTWHEMLPDAFNKLIPPREPVRVLHHDGNVKTGARACLRAGIWPIAFKWELRHEEYVKNKQFCDRQIKGPFKSWYHTHSFIPVTANSSRLNDRIEFEMPFGLPGLLIGKLIVIPKLRKLFEYRHKATKRDIAAAS